MITIKRIDSEATLAIRSIVLRSGKIPTECRFDGDALETTFHLGAFYVDKLVGIVSVYKENFKDFSCKRQSQLRGMAVLDSHRNLEIGKKLLQKAEEVILRNKAEFLWCNARISAENFYKKQGFIPFGEYFNINEIGLHVKMYKILEPV